MSLFPRLFHGAFFSAAVIAMFANAVAAQTIRYVDRDAPGANDGSSWCDAFNTLQDALTAANAGDELRVARGVYLPDQGAGQVAGDRDASFLLTNDITLLGGYAGCGTPDPDFRDVDFHETILSGDLLGDDQPPWDPFISDNSRHIIMIITSGGSIVVDGFTIAGANSEQMFTNGGGALVSFNTSPTFRDCTFTRNRAERGGGAIAARRSSMKLVDCRFFENSARIGGALLIEQGSTPELTRCTFEGNEATDSETSPGVGGGFYYIGETPDPEPGPTLTDCVFRDNIAGNAGAMFNSISNGTFLRCLFIGNSATGVGSSFTGISGGVENRGFGSPTLTDCVFAGNSAASGGGGFDTRNGAPVLTNCLFSGNSANTDGGGMLILTGKPTITNCTFSANTVVLGVGGGLSTEETGSTSTEGGTPVITNSIFWGNTQADGDREGGQITIQSGVADINYSCVEGWSGAFGGVGNTGNDPLFADPNGPDDVLGTDDDDLHLSAGSACVDAGDNDADINASTATTDPLPGTDLGGQPRFIDDPDIPDTGNSGAMGPPVVDMGAYERNPDCNGNGIDDTVDLAVGTSSDCNKNGIPDECEQDFDGDGIVGPCDNCPRDANPDQQDADLDGAGDVCDPCPLENPDDADGDGVCAPDDQCPADPTKLEPGPCGCGALDSDGDGVLDCLDQCPTDPTKVEPGQCGCGVSDTADVDGDGVPDCVDQCPEDPAKVAPGQCGCGVSDTADSDGDGVPDCIDQCPGVDDAVFGPACADAIPTASNWGLVVFALLLLCAAKIQSRDVRLDSKA